MRVQPVADVRGFFIGGIQHHVGVAPHRPFHIAKTQHLGMHGGIVLQLQLLLHTQMVDVVPVVQHLSLIHI